MDVKLISITAFEENQEENIAFLSDCAGIIFGTPDYCAAEALQMKKFRDTCPVKFDGKLGGVFATANYPQGGADTAIQSILIQLLVKGMLLYSVGASLGQPYIHLGSVCIGEQMNGLELFPIFGQRFAEKALELF